MPLLLLLLFFLPLAAVAAPPAPDTLVVCPAEFREALVPWEAFRRSQGHEILVIEPPPSARLLQAAIRRVGESGELKYLLLIGDVPSDPGAAKSNRLTVPTNYLPAKINIRWGAESSIATDIPYADLDGDQKPDLAVGRIPADTTDELAAVVRKIIRHELNAVSGDWERRLEVVAGVGGFGIVTDRLIEAAASQVLLQTIPSSYQIRQTMANPKSPHCPAPGKFGAHVRERLNEGCFAWIYLGHGLSTELDRVRTSAGEETIMTVADIDQIRCGEKCPLAVMIACYTGAIDGKSDCLAERLLLSEEGPVAVIAATRVTMPYGNTVLGYELLRSCFNGQSPSIGDMLRTAQQRTLADSDPNDPLRASFDALAQALSPPPVDLPAERREHVAMYHLLGDPLGRVRIQLPQAAAKALEDRQDP